MKRVTGLGGVFFKSNDPEKLREWYRAHLEIEVEKEGAAMFKWRKLDDPERESCTVWSPFSSEKQLKREGVDVDPRGENCDCGKFGWIMDPEGNRIELWEPPK
jgi:hypothetical protein